MEFEPKQKNKAPDLLILGLFLCGVCCLVFGNINGVVGKGVLQIIAVVFFCIMIFVAVKYKFTRLRYTVRKKAPKGYGDEDGAEISDDTPVISCPPSSLELIVETAQGRRTFIGENLVSLDKITEFCPVPEVKSEKKALLTKYKKASKYKYLKNMVGAGEYLLAAKTEMGDAVLIIEPDEKMAQYLSAVARYNRDNTEK